MSLTSPLMTAGVHNRLFDTVPVIQRPLTVADEARSRPKRSLCHHSSCYWFLQSGTDNSFEIFANSTVKIFKPKRTGHPNTALIRISRFMSLFACMAATGSWSSQSPHHCPITLQGALSGAFLCMHAHGKVYTSLTATEDCAFCEQTVGLRFAYYRARPEYCKHSTDATGTPHHHQYPCCSADDSVRDKMYVGLNARQQRIMDGRRSVNCAFHSEHWRLPYYCRDVTFMKVHPAPDGDRSDLYTYLRSVDSRKKRRIHSHQIENG